MEFGGTRAGIGHAARSVLDALMPRQPNESRDIPKAAVVAGLCVSLRIGPPVARRMRVRLTLDADPGQRHRAGHSLCSVPARGFPALDLVLTPVPIVDDPTIPRAGAEAGEGATD